jgi:hypothetical protein
VEERDAYTHTDTGSVRKRALLYYAKEKSTLLHV